MKKQTRTSPSSRKAAPAPKTILAAEIAATKKEYEARALAEFRARLAEKKIPSEEEILGSWNVNYYFGNVHKNMLKEVLEDGAIYAAQAAYAKKYKAELKKVLLKFYKTAPTPAELMGAARDIAQSSIVDQAVRELEQELKDSAKQAVLDMIKT